MDNEQQQPQSDERWVLLESHRRTDRVLRRHWKACRDKKHRGGYRKPGNEFSREGVKRGGRCVFV